jgi:hypothetical protein
MWANRFVHGASLSPSRCHAAENGASLRQGPGATVADRNTFVRQIARIHGQEHAAIIVCTAASNAVNAGFLIVLTSSAHVLPISAHAGAAAKASEHTGLPGVAEENRCLLSRYANRHLAEIEALAAGDGCVGVAVGGDALRRHYRLQLPAARADLAGLHRVQRTEDRAHLPPVTSRNVPVTKDASALASHRIARAT